MLTVEELTIVKMYKGFNADRYNVLSSLKNSLAYIDNNEIKETTKSTIRKINAMSDENFKEIDFSESLEETPEEKF